MVHVGGLFLLAAARRRDTLLKLADVIFCGVQPIETGARQQGKQLVGGVACVRRQPQRIVIPATVRVRHALPEHVGCLDGWRRRSRLRRSADGRRRCDKRGAGCGNLPKKVHRPPAGALKTQSNHTLSKFCPVKALP